METQKDPQLCTKAIVYVPLCQGNHIAAALFDWVLTYTEIERRLRYHEPFYVYVETCGGPLADPNPFEQCLGYEVDVDANLMVTIADLQNLVTPQMVPPAVITSREICHALDLLRRQRLLSWHPLGENTRTPDTQLYISTIYEPHIDEALVALYQGRRTNGTEAQFDLARERRIVREQCSRAGRIGQAASLTLEEWLETLTHFQGRCAFQANHPYDVLEHFIPVVYGGGTTVFNCIPACRSCNAVKNDRLPDDLRHTRLGPVLSQIQAYLDRCRDQWLNKQG